MSSDPSLSSWFPDKRKVPHKKNEKSADSDDLANDDLSLPKGTYFISLPVSELFISFHRFASSPRTSFATAPAVTASLLGIGKITIL